MVPPCGFRLRLWLAWAALLEVLGEGSQDRTAADAAGAASYWRGRRVRQEEDSGSEENADRSLHLDLALSLRCLAKFFWHYPVVIFHTNSSSPAELRWLSSVVPERLLLGWLKIRLDPWDFFSGKLTVGY
eukprot:s1293_g18.t1